MNTGKIAPYLQVAPFALIMILFVGLPLLTILTISFWISDGFLLEPAFTLENYAEILSSRVVLTLFLDTIRYALITLIVTTIIGFTCAYFLAFYVTSLKIQIGLLLLCTIPFWTSNIIRMISWIPFLGREGVFNSALQALGITDAPLDFLLFSDFAVILTYTHLYTLFMIVPIFNSMAKIDPAIIEAARDAGATGWQILIDIIIPLSKSGLALGAIFVVTLVMGDFFIVKIMSGGQSASVMSAMKNDIDQLYYAPASALAVMLIIVVIVMVALILRVVDVRQELASGKS